MDTTVKKILKDALHLSPGERAVVAEGLLSSLNRPDPEIDKLWAEEAEARIGAVEQGEMKTVTEDEVFEKYEKS